MLGSLGWQELLIILAILALVFGASRVADLGGALGRGIREFRQEAKGDADKAADTRSLSSRILRRAQVLAKLPEHDQKSVLRMIDALAAATPKGRKAAVR